MTFQLEGDVPGYLGDENPIKFTSPTDRVHTVRPPMAFSNDPRQSNDVPHSRELRRKIGFAHQVSSGDLTIYEVGSFRLLRPFKPHFPQKIQATIEKMMRRPLRPSEMVNLIDEICIISADFYKIKNGKHIAVRLDGTVVESADSELDLLLKIQGRQFSVPVFVYEVGADSSLGW